MGSPLPFANWSLKKAQEAESDSFVKGRISIMYTMLLFSIFKAVVVIFFGSLDAEWPQVTRAAIALGLYIVLTKILLYKPSAMKAVAHIMIVGGFIVIWTNIFGYAQKINLVTLQFIFMIILGSFYTLGSFFGILYSILSVAPVIVFLILRGDHTLYFGNNPREFHSPGYEVIVCLNFVSIIVVHYLFYRAFYRNICEKEQLNCELQSAIAEANKLATSRANFLSTISHELRTPLNSVIGIAELLIEDKPEERQMENLKILQFSAMDLLALINNVLDFNKIDSDKLVLENVPLDLAEFMRSICSAMRIKAIGKRLHFILEIDRELEGVTVVTDPTRLSQIIYNLTGNALKFTDKGNITVSLSCVSKNSKTVDVLFSVADTGMGIHPDRHDTIFDMFTQAESNITRKYGGTGLGLAIVRQVLRLFNSSIQLESSLNEGSRFFFTISFATASTVTGKTTVVTELSDLSRLRVLIAEDNDVNRSLVRKQLERLDVKPVIVENGIQAFDACLANVYDVIFLDLHMPEMDGYEAIRQIRAAGNANSRAWIIAFTASVNEQQKIISAGFNDYLHKPVNMSDLRDKLEKIPVSSGLRVA